MQRPDMSVRTSQLVTLILVIVNVLILRTAFVSGGQWYWLLLLTPLLLLFIKNPFKKISR